MIKIVEILPDLSGIKESEFTGTLTIGQTAFEYDAAGIPIKRMVFGEEWKDYVVPWVLGGGQEKKG